MPVSKFPDPRSAGPDGLLALGGDLHPETLVLAYRQGIFPWPMDGYPLAWFCPKKRGVLDFADLHIPRSLARAVKRHAYRVSFDEAFESVIHACSVVPRAGQQGTWITDEMIRAYIKFHRCGYAHSVEVWEGVELVGGLYGVEVGGVFAGESMFHLRPNTSKIALLALIERLAAAGAKWMDIQVITPHMKALGAKLIARDRFLARLAGRITPR